MKVVKGIAEPGRAWVSPDLSAEVWGRDFDASSCWEWRFDWRSLCVALVEDPQTPLENASAAGDFSGGDTGG